MELPNELLIEIVSYVANRHDTSNYVVETKNLSALVATSRTMRNVATPFLFRDVVINNQQKLNALSCVPGDLLALVQ